MERSYTEEFTIADKTFLYIDFSGVRTNEEFLDRTSIIEPIIAKYPPNSLYTITNVDNIRFDSESKNIVAAYMSRNKPYVKYGAVIGLDGIKKLMITAIFAMSGRSNNMHFAFTREQAIEWLLKQS